MRKCLTVLIAVISVSLFAAKAVEKDKPVTRTFVYKKAGDAKLKMRVYYPPHWTSKDKKLPAVVFFFGGGWQTGTFGHFGRQAAYLASRGMIAVCPQYRTQKSHKVTPDKCLQDAKSAMRYVYSHADELGIDKSRIAAGGGSAGGHLAAATAFCEGFNDPADNLSVTCKPMALVLFNPVIDNSEKGYGYSRVKKYWKEFSPLHNIKKNNLPVLFQIGDKDKLVPVSTAKAFKQKIEDNGGTCKLIIYPEAQHGFFNYSKRGKKSKYYPDTIKEMDKFMVKIGFIPAKDIK